MRVYFMIKYFYLLFFCAVLVAQAGPDELDGLVGRWLDYRTELAAERLAWQEQEPALKEELALLDRELAALRAEADAYAAETSEGEAEELEAAARREALAAALNEVLPVLDRAEAELRGWSVRVPAVLAGGAERLFRELPATPSAARAQSTGERLQRVIALLSQLETLSQNWHAVQESVPSGDGTRRLVQVLYIGLARAYAVSPDGTWAAIGTPGLEGWIWEPRPSAAPAIREALAIHARQQVAAFVELPLQVMKVTP
jgi:hypothetical protein